MLKKVLSPAELSVGDKVRYKSVRGIQVVNKKGATYVSVGAEYDGEVVQITDHIVVLQLTADQGTLHRMSIDKPTPFKWSVMKHDIETGYEFIFKERYEILEP